MLRLFFDDHPPCSAAGLPNPARDADRMRLLSLRPAPTRHIMPVSDVLRLFSATVSDTTPHVPVDRGAARRPGSAPQHTRRMAPDTTYHVCFRHNMPCLDARCRIDLLCPYKTFCVGFFCFLRPFRSRPRPRSDGLPRPFPLPLALHGAPESDAFRARIPFFFPVSSAVPPALRSPTLSPPARTSPAGPISPGPVFPPRTAPAFCLVSRPRSPRFVSRSAPRQNSTQHIHTRHVGPSFHRQRAPFRAVRSKK